MTDYYSILGLDRSASSTQLRVAYKRMAMLYHPDRNAGNKEAEEKFKLINEAYQVLSDPLKRAHYDNRQEYQAQNAAENYWRDMQQRKDGWQRHRPFSYIIDKNYFRIQGLAFLVFIIISGLCFSIIHTVNYFINKSNEAHWQKNTLHLKQVNALFDNGRFDEAFSMIYGLQQREPLEFRFILTRDSLIDELRTSAEQKFRERNFEEAFRKYEVVRHHEQATRNETLQRIAICQFYLGNYDASLNSLKQLYNQDPGNIELAYQIAILELEIMKDKTEALYYLTEAKKIFKKNLTEVYGAAFEVVMKPEDVPDIYYRIFEARAQVNLSMGNYTDAITDCNWGISLRKSNTSFYKMRAQAKIGAQHYNDLCSDLSKATPDDADVKTMQVKYCRESFKVISAKIAGR